MGWFFTKTYPPLQVVPKCETDRFMGVWFVVGVKPTIFEKTNSNAVEIYTRTNSAKGHDIDIDFQFNVKEPITSTMKALPQKGWVTGENKELSSTWTVSPMFPIKLSYPIIELDEDNYDYVVVGSENRAYAWIMGRSPVMKDETYNMLKQRLVERHQYDLEGFRDVPQVWTREEREKRDLDSIIPDELLSDQKI
jgi:lipocalin